MSRSSIRGVFAAAGAAALLVLACSAEAPPVLATPEESLCDAMAATREKCSGGCEDVLRSECAKLAGGMHPAAVRQATDCFLSGACSSVCLSKALSSLEPTEGQIAVRAAYCGTCAKGQGDCQAKFFEAARPSTPGGAGTQLLPFADDVTRSIPSDCASQEGCQLGFPPCTLESVKRGLTPIVGAASAECLVRGLKAEETDRRSPDGGAIVVTCSAKNCAGCCRDDLCLLGNTKDACGTAGASCETCSGTASCEANACKVPCGPETCAGCCENNTCVEGTTKDACGKSGAACTKCGASFVCSEQSCIDTSCKSTCSGCCSGSTCLSGTGATACGKSGSSCVDCGKGRTCSATGCALDPNALFDVVLSYAIVPSRTKSGGAWDFYENLPDPFARAFSSLGSTSHAGATLAVADTTAPQWNASILTQVPARELLNSFSVELWDDDYDYDDFIGGCVVKLDASMFTGTLKVARCPATPSGLELTVGYKLVPR